MRKHLLAHLLLAAVIPIFTCAQTSTPKENPIWNWENSPRLPVIYPDDSVAIRASVDSLTPLVAGRWALIEIENGWGPNHVPARAVELVLDQDGHGTIYENGVWSAVFTLKLTRLWGLILFSIDEPGKPFFNFQFTKRSRGDVHRGHIRFDKQRLIISNGYADGTAYAFRRMPDPQPPKHYINYSATALLNYKPWFGTAKAFRVRKVKNKPCTTNRFLLVIRTDLPHDGQKLEQSGQPTGCIDGCVPTQLLTIDNIPLAIGTYEIAGLDTCCGTSSACTRYDLLSGGDGLVDRYLPRYSNRIWMTKYDKRAKRVEGKFELGLYSDEGKYVYFKDGVFSATLSKP